MPLIKYTLKAMLVFLLSPWALNESHQKPVKLRMPLPLWILNAGKIFVQASSLGTPDNDYYLFVRMVLAISQTIYTWLLRTAKAKFPRFGITEVCCPCHDPLTCDRNKNLLDEHSQFRLQAPSKQVTKKTQKTPKKPNQNQLLCCWM